MEKAIDSKKFKEFCDDNEIIMYHTFSEVKVSIAERMIRTLKEKFERIKTQSELGIQGPQEPLENLDFKLSKILLKVLQEYNNTIHNTTKITPVDARKKDNENILQEMYRYKFETYLPKKGRLFKIGDHVRISVYKNIFTKRYKHNWSQEIFTISQIHKTVPITYTVKDESEEEITNNFYAQELFNTNY